VLCCDPLAKALMAASSAQRAVTPASSVIRTFSASVHQGEARVSVYKREVGVGARRGTKSRRCKGLLATTPHRACVWIATLRAIHPGGHFFAHPTPNSRVVLSACAPNGRERPAHTRDQVPLRDAWGPASRMSPVSLLIPSARDRGQRCQAPQVLLSVNFSAYSRKELHVRT
jgi:hypothetical protein